MVELHEFSAKGSAIGALIIALFALIFGTFNIHLVQTYRENSVAVPEQIVKKGWTSASLKFAKPDGRQVEERVKGFYLGYDEGEQVTVRLYLTHDNAPVQVDNFLTNWAVVIAAGWVTFCFTAIGLTNLMGHKVPMTLYIR